MKTLFLSLKLAVSLLTALLLLITGCDGLDCSGGNGGVKPKTASVSISVKSDRISGPTTGKCEWNIVFTFEPIKLTGSEGRETRITVDKTFSTLPTRRGEGWYCFFNHTEYNLRAGTWRIRARDARWTTDCEVVLRAGANIAHFSVSRQGCTSDFSYPGE